MTDLLIAPSSASSPLVGRPAPALGLVHGLVRRRALAQFARLQSGAVLLREGAGGTVFGNPAGALGTVPLDVHDGAFWGALAARGALGAGEAYVAGHWSSADPVALLRLFLRDREVLSAVDRTVWTLPARLLLRAHHWLRDNHRTGSRRNIQDHYDLGDELFAQFLDPSLTYSAAWFAHPEQSLAEAQQHKLERLCRLVDLQPGDRLLEIGTGWGSLALVAAGRFGAQVTTTTISARQFARAQQRFARAGLQERVTLLQRDYRDLDGTFDKLLSCEMIEAVGARWLPTYLQVCAARLRPGGRFGLQAITIRDQQYDAALRSVDYIKRHVFPGSFIPSVQAIVTAASRHTDLRLVQLADFGEHYATTLAHWRSNLLAAPEPFLRAGGPNLLRAWDYYFAYCEAGFRERQLGVAQMLFERPGAAR
ncbi:MAG: class I SAM-dependent methyltransferase [Planctomycetes bacterium]|nr:class I SAM-dependent methyltransferase [Planctomycetota bacterium]